MIGLKNGVDVEDAKKVLVENGYKIRDVEPGSYILAELPGYESADAQRKSITDIEALNEFIEYAEPNYLVYPSVLPNDPAISSRKLWGLDNQGTVAGSIADADIDAPEGWDIRHDAPDVIVAVTDTGIQYNHEDLELNMWIHPTTGKHGYDAYDNDDDPMDTGGHGTHCAGTIGARGDNGKGLTGVAWKLKLMAGRFLGPNGGTTSDGIRVINYARENGAHIISASWGGGGYSQSLYNAIKAAGDAGIPFIAAAGNDTSNNDATPHYPSSYDLTTLVAVASTNRRDNLSYFSCYGRNSVDIAAPGSDILSSYIGTNTSYKHLNGTSMATPHVSGALALARAEFPLDDVEDLIARLYSSVDSVPALAEKLSTGGRLNLHKLLGESSSSVSNDHFENALRLYGSTAHWRNSNRKATREADEDAFSLPGTGTHSLWFEWKAPYSGLVEFVVSSSDLSFQSIVFEGSEKETLHSARILSSGENATSKNLRFYCKADQKYRWLIDSHTGRDFTLQMTLKPDNDNLLGARSLSSQSFSEKADNSTATAEDFERRAPHAEVGKGKSLWWKWTSPVNGDFVISTHGSEFDTVLAVYTGDSLGLINTTFNDDANAMDWTSRVNFSAVAGTTYYIAVDSYRSDAAGKVILNGFRQGQLTFMRQPESVTLPLGERAELESALIDEKGTSLQWFFDGVAMPGQISSTLVIDPIESWSFGTYTVVASRGDQQVTSVAAELIERKTAPLIAWSSGDQMLPTGSDCQLGVRAIGSTPLTYTWYKNGVVIPAAITNKLSFLPLTENDDAHYRCKVSNSMGSISAELRVRQIDAPWESWAWRHPSMPRYTITDIKAYSDVVYAVSGKKLMVSTDGDLWTEERFPYGFIAQSFEQIGSTRLCLGRGYLGRCPSQFQKPGKLGQHR